MKVVWICHFANEEINSLVKLHKRVDEFAPWIPNLVKGFENRKDIELNIIAPLIYIKKLTNIKLRGVNYYFLPTGVPYIHCYYPTGLPLDVIFKFNLFNKRVKEIVENLNPDIINLIGAENAHYASSIFKLNKYPVIVFIQGFVSELPIPVYSIRTRHRAKIEIKILKSFKNFIGEEDSKKYIESFNKDFNFYKAYFPTNEELISKVNKNHTNFKEFDLIYFGRLDIIKGTLEFLKVVSAIKKKNPKIKAAVVGPGDIKPYYNFAVENHISDNVDFISFLKNQEELFNVVKASKIVLIPSLKERLPSTLRESMLLKIPVVAYSTGGLPYVNRERENIKLVQTGDFEKMADESLKLLSDENYRERLINNAYEYALEEFSLENNVNRIVQAYHKTIEYYNK